MVHKRTKYLIYIAVLLFVALTALTGGTFASPENVRDMITGIASEGIMAAGVLVVLITGGIDISFTSTATVAQYLAAYLLLRIPGIHLPEVLILTLLAGIALGMINGLLVTVLKVPSIIVTIATMNIYFGFLIRVSGGKLMNRFPQWFAAKNSFTIGYFPCLLLIAVFVLTGWILTRTRMGRYIFAVGGNRISAQRMGISILKVNLFAYGYLGLLAAVGAVLQLYLSQAAAPNNFTGNEMNVLAMVVLGGAALTGGSGSALGTLLGVLLIGAAGNGLVLTGVSSYWFDFVTGLIILLSFCMTGLGDLVGKKNKKRRAAYEENQSES